MNCLGLRVIASATIAFLIPQTGAAAEWRPISLTAGDEPYASYNAFVYSSDNFLDGVYTSAGEFMLSNAANVSSTPTFAGETRTVISFSSYFGVPPIVDQNQRTVDVSSIWAEVFYADWGCNVDPFSCDYRFDRLVWTGVIGWNFGPTTPVDYEVNADGTFTAIWNAPDSQNFYSGFGNQTIRFTFAAAVPEPGLALSFVVGLVVVAGRTLRGKRIRP